jgi:two-component system, NtrC family, response regulator HydG
MTSKSAGNNAGTPAAAGTGKPSDRRRFGRRAVRLPLQVELCEARHGWGDGRGWTLDVSPNGALLAVWSTVAPAKGEEVRVRIGPMSQSHDALSDVGLARVAHVQFTRPMLIGLDLIGDPSLDFSAPELVGTSRHIRQVKSTLRQLAANKLNVLITGETGTGKSVLAKIIHMASPNAGKPFVRVNCPAIPSPLFESELFGHEKGAFTGADRATPGHFRLAADGTILLDEISEIDLQLQAKLLRVIEDREFVPVGGTEVLPTHARILATTNISVVDALRQGILREDLYYRLHEVSIHLRPLRERVEDIPLLAEHFLAEFSTDFQTPAHPISADLMQQLCAYKWPGNVRELKNAVRRFAMGEPIDLSESRQPPHDEAREADHKTKGTIVSIPANKTLKALKEEFLTEAESAHIEATLKSCGGNRSKAARILGISYRTILRKIEKYRIHV